MPITYDIEAGIIVVQIGGLLTGQEFADYLAATLADPRYRQELPRLVLIADDTTFPSSPEIIALAGKAATRHLTSGARFACVARSPLAIGITSMFMGNAGLGSNYQVFEDATAAKAWLMG